MLDERRETEFASVGVLLLRDRAETSPRQRWGLRSKSFQTQKFNFTHLLKFCRKGKVSVFTHLVQIVFRRRGVTSKRHSYDK